MTWSAAVPGAALLAAVGYGVLHSRTAIPAGHPAYLVWLIAVALLGAGLLVWAFAGKQPARGPVRAVLRWAAAAFAVGLAAVTAWLAPYEATTIPEVPSRSSATGILLPAADPQDTGVAFIPGALVDPRAYKNILEPLVAAGYPVYIAKPAFGVAFAVPDVVADAEAAAPGVEQWVVAGHSLGGAVASGQTDGAAGLILLGAYPIDDVRDTGVPVLSISGTDDALTTPADVADSKQELPPDAQFVVIEGGVHAFFGDYGEQRGDGQPTTSREVAQERTQEAMLAFLRELPPAAP